MHRWFSSLWLHLLLIILVWALVCLPNLGGATLWDIDEGNNAECSYEMMESGNWIVPTFNYRLRVDKPALLYWMQILAYKTMGVNEFAARFPCTLGALASLLALYFMGKTMFGAEAGLAGALTLAGMPAFVGAAHFANPDSLLNASFLCTLLAFYLGYQKGTSTWMLWTGITTGLGMLAKGPIALAMPGLIILLFLIWERQWKRLLSIHLIGSALLFSLVAVPWYAWVGVETKFEWHRGFFFTHNLGRFSAPMENHGGPWYYYLLVLAVGAAPWSVFSGFAFLHLRQGLGTRHDLPSPARSATRFLLVAFFTVVIFFSISRTKLPNYILPAYGSMALIISSAMVSWMRGTLSIPNWLPKTGFTLLMLMGILVAIGLLVASGILGQFNEKMRIIPGVQSMIWIGAIPLLSGCIGWLLYTKASARAAMAAVCLGGIFFSSALGAWNGSHFNTIKAPKALAALLPPDQLKQEIRLGAFEWFQPSIAFYCKREISMLNGEGQLRAFLKSPLPSFVYLPLDRWNEISAKGVIQGRLVGTATDFYRNFQVVLISNQ